jgi:transposase InsO family protein
MPWKDYPVSQQRIALVHQLLIAGRPLAQVAREFGVSRKTAYKWRERYQLDRDAPLADRSRRPRRSPGRCDEQLESRVLALRRQYNWGPRKIHRLLLDDRQVKPIAVPSIRTVATILKRRGCVGADRDRSTDPPAPPQSFERSGPNELWQLDHKGPIEVARQRVTPLTVIDDHSRYCLCFAPLSDVTLTSLWPVLWDLFGEVGLPEAILCDNAFSGRSVGLSSFDAALVRLNVKPIHGRAYHPQTQGKVERLHRSANDELIHFDARRDRLDHFADDCQRWRNVYNTIRPHEALGDRPPAARWWPSHRKRPAVMPTEVSYPSDAITRRVSVAGDFRYQNARIVVGRALCGQTCRIEPREHELAVYYSWKLLRVIPNTLLGGPRSHKII